MAKKKTERETEEKEVRAEIAAPYSISTWAGFPQYCCNYCAYDSLDHGKIMEHLIGAHSTLTTPPATEEGENETKLKEDEDAKNNDQ